MIFGGMICERGWEEMKWSERLGYIDENLEGGEVS
jgi:hypothetical protein